MFAASIVLAVFLFLALSALAVLSLKFLKNRRLELSEWESFKPEKIGDPGSVKRLRILPLIDWYAGDERLTGEAGVSWLVEAGDAKILMDAGLNWKNEEKSTLLRNMETLGVRLGDVKHLFLSHLHMDHVGGLAAQKERTVKLGAGEPDLSHLTIYAPTELRHQTADVRLITGPKVLLPGVATEGPIPRSIFAMGLTREQALAVNVEGKGLVLIIGCGHQGLRRIFERAEAVFDVPVYGLVGGLHFPVTESRMKVLGLPMQKILGTGKFPWNNITKDEVRDAIEFLKTKNLGLVSVSAHDSCDWTLNEFRKAFPDTYKELKVGVPLSVGS